MVMYSPCNPQKWRPVQFISAASPNGGGIETDGEAGHFRFETLPKIIEHLFGLHNDGFVIYTMVEGAKVAGATTGDLWQVVQWNSRVSHYLFARTVKILPFSSISHDVNSVWPFFEWARNHGIAASGLTSMARTSWRRSLAEPMTFFDTAALGKYTIYGSRKEAIRGTYDHIRYQDLSSAFPTTMAESEFPRIIKEARGKGPYPGGYAFATVRIPKNLPWYPIPCRIGKRFLTYTHGEQRDWWTFEDLQNVTKVGGEVRVHQAFRPFNFRPVFRDWWQDLILPARGELEGDARHALKAMSNRLWSSFCVAGTKRTLRYVDGQRRRIIDHEANDIGSARYEAFVSASVLAMIRTRVFDALNEFRMPIYVDTDGIMCKEMEDAGNGWRVKNKFRTVEIHSPQNYMYECYRCGVYADPYCGGPHYSIASPTPPSRREAEIALKSEDQIVNPLMGVTVQARENDLETLRQRYAYEQPSNLESDDIIWDSDIPATGIQTEIPL